MEQLSAPARRLAAAPRHLHRRLLHDDIPDTLLVPDAEPVPVPRKDSEPAASSTPRPAPKSKQHGPALASRELKRKVALLLVFAVTLSITALLLALLFAV